MTTTGFGSGNFVTWGSFAVYVAFLLALVGGCSGTSSSSLSVFRVIILFKAVRRAVMRIMTPDRVLPIRYGGRAVDMDTVDGVAFFVTLYAVLFAGLTVAMSLTGVGIEAAIFGVWSTFTNTGYSAGPLVAATGTFVDYPDAAKWLMILAMLTGRLGYLSFFLLLLPRFWRG
jgi:trk system potassium uptake protein TrkH